MVARGRFQLRDLERLFSSIGLHLLADVIRPVVAAALARVGIPQRTVAIVCLNLDADALQACASAVECIIKDGSSGLCSVEIIAVQLSMDFVKDFFQPYLRQRSLDASVPEHVAIPLCAKVDKHTGK